MHCTSKYRSICYLDVAGYQKVIKKTLNDTNLITYRICNPQYRVYHKKSESLLSWDSDKNKRFC